MATAEAVHVLDTYLYNIDENDKGMCCLFDELLDTLRRTIDLAKWGHVPTDAEKCRKSLLYWHDCYRRAACAEIKKIGDWYAGGRLLISEALFRMAGFLEGED